MNVYRHFFCRFDNVISTLCVSLDNLNGLTLMLVLKSVIPDFTKTRFQSTSCNFMLYFL